MMYSNSWICVDLDAIEANFDAVCQRANAPVCAVIKADAYGHGAVPVAKILKEKAAFFGVASVAEALELRNAGIAKPILLLGHTDPELFETVIEKDIRPAIFREEEAQLLSQAAVRIGKIAKFHIKVDTGMSRVGFQATEACADIVAQVVALPNLEAEGMFTHFATADSWDLTATKEQAARFAAFDGMLQARGVNIPLKHIDNSAGTMNFGCHYDMVRAGIVLYGLYPSDEVDTSLLTLRPAMSWHTKIAHLKLLEPGRAISYGGTFVTERPTMVATIPVGYADGYRRSMSNQFYVLIRGKRAPILGRVCMDQFMVDVTDIPDVQMGDPVVLMGTSGDEIISAETIGAAAQSFNYEQVCDVGRRVTRVYIRGGEEVQSVNYLLQ